VSSAACCWLPNSACRSLRGKGFHLHRERPGIGQRQRRLRPGTRLRRLAVDARLPAQRIGAYAGVLGIGRDEVGSASDAFDEVGRVLAGLDPGAQLLGGKRLAGDLQGERHAARER
jgi:hypothetical protein